MDDHFLKSLKSFSAQDILEDHGEARQRLGTSRGRKQSSHGERGLSLFTEKESPNGIPDISEGFDSWNRPETGMAFSRSKKPIPSSAFQDKGSEESSKTSKRPPSSKPSYKEETIEFIPDLAEVQEEDLTATVADAPQSEVEKMASLKELDEELEEKKAFSEFEGVDLELLCRFVIPEKDLVEAEETWDWDTLFSQVSTEYKLININQDKD